MTRTTEQFAYGALFAYYTRWNHVRRVIRIKLPRGETRRRIRHALAAIGALSYRV